MTPGLEGKRAVQAERASADVLTAEPTATDGRAAAVARVVTLRVARFDPDHDTALRWQAFEVPVIPGMTVLDALFAVKEHQDGSLAFRSSCRMGVCGSCGMFINGKPRLACQTQVAELPGRVIEVAPLPNHDVIKDLVPDLTPTFEKHRAVKPYIIRPGDEAEMETPTREFAQTPEELEAYVQFSYCLKCSLCVAACPTVASDPLFLGPQALGQAFRYTADTRDAGFADRLSTLDHPEGPFGCHLAGACSEACPKGVDPAFAIQLLKRAMVFGPPRREPAGLVAPAATGAAATAQADDQAPRQRPQAPPPTVDGAQRSSRP